MSYSPHQRHCMAEVGTAPVFRGVTCNMLLFNRDPLEPPDLKDLAVAQDLL